MSKGIPSGVSGASRASSILDIIQNRISNFTSKNSQTSIPPIELDFNNQQFAAQKNQDYLRSSNMGDYKNIKNSNLALKNEVISGSNHLNKITNTKINKKRQNSMLNYYENDLDFAPGITSN